MVIVPGFSVAQVNVTDWPRWIVFGSAVKETIRTGSRAASWYADRPRPAGGCCGAAGACCGAPGAWPAADDNRQTAITAALPHVVIVFVISALSPQPSALTKIESSAHQATRLRH